MGCLKLIEIMDTKNSRLPNRRNPWGNGKFIVLGENRLFSLTKGFRSFSDNVNKPIGLLMLVKLTETNIQDKQFVNTNVTQIVSNVDILIASYQAIQLKNGNINKRSNQKITDRINMTWFHNIAKNLRDGSFYFHPFHIVTLRDKIVQQAIVMVLTAIFEPIFVETSHGFRPGKDYHTALKLISLKFGSVNWLIQGNISKCFDSFNHKLLISAILERITDQIFMNLLHQALNAGYINSKSLYQESNFGILQGSIISPILCNILLHNFDKWVSKYRETFNKREWRKANQIYTKLSFKDKCKKLSYINKNEIQFGLVTNPLYIRLIYVRYAHTFIIGTIGSKSDCITIIKHINYYLWDYLMLTLNKTKITHTCSKKAHFLGINVSITPYNKKLIRLITRYEKSKKSIVLNAPIRKIVEKLVANGFAKNKVTGQPTKVGRFIHFDTPLIYESFLSVARGLINYYFFVDNYVKMSSRILYITKYSLALTIAAKFKMKTLHKVFCKYGPTLKFTTKTNKVYCFDLNTFVLSAPGLKTGVTKYNPFLALEIATKKLPRTKILLDNDCSLCGFTIKLKVHHIKYIRKQSEFIQGNYLIRTMLNMNRKQITVCNTCYQNVHACKYNVLKL